MAGMETWNAASDGVRGLDFPGFCRLEFGIPWLGPGNSKF